MPGILTWNLLRADTQAWAARRARAKRLLDAEQPDILCVQEALPHQLADLREWLPTHHLLAGCPDARGERNAMLVRASRYDVRAVGTEDLPGEVPRAASWARLHDRVDGTTLTVVNLHLDHESEETRLVEAERVRALFPGALLAGDLNAVPGSPTHRVLMEGRTDPFPAAGAETMHGGATGETTGTSPNGPPQADARYDAILLPHELPATGRRVVPTDASDHHALRVDLAAVSRDAERSAEDHDDGRGDDERDRDA